MAAVGIIAALLTACGGGDDSAQDQVADEFLDQIDDDAAFDEDCVRDAFGELSDDDAQAVLDSLDSGDEPDIGLEAAGVIDDLMSCADVGALIDDIGSDLPDVSLPDVSLPDDLGIDQMLDDLESEGFDGDCLREVIGDIDASNADPQELMAAAVECMDVGG